MEGNKYDGICFLFLCAIAPLFFSFLFADMSDNYVQIILCSVSLLFWIIIISNKNFNCNTTFATLVTIIYLILISMNIVMNYSIANIFYQTLMMFLSLVIVIFFVINLWKSNHGN